MSAAVILPPVATAARPSRVNAPGQRRRTMPNARAARRPPGFSTTAPKRSWAAKWLPAKHRAQRVVSISRQTCCSATCTRWPPVGQTSV
jgi:hypothetical protein